MPNYVVRCTITRSITLEAESEQDAIDKAPNPDDVGEWDVTDIEFEADEETEYP